MKEPESAKERRVPAQEEKGRKDSALPSPALPKGGGALAPIGEKLTVNPQTGTASFSIPIATSPGRSGFGPQLALSYDSGAGQGPYGLGWSVDVPSISRKTEKGLPLYDDERESDVFILAGVEDLVPVATETRGAERVVVYRPRVDNAFSPIERRTRADGSSYWVTISRDNVRSVFGYSSWARLSDPADDKRVFRWMLQWTDDDKGNVVAYVYKQEDPAGIGSIAEAPAEYRRSRTNLYPKAIAYGNRTPRGDRAVPPVDLDAPGATRASVLAAFPFVVLFDYGDHDADDPRLSEGTWALRPDSFSSYRSTFEIRTHRLCQRILMLHQFDELAPRHVVVRSTNFTYNSDAAALGLSQLVSVQQEGWRYLGNDAFERAALPPIALGYQPFETADVGKPLDSENLSASGGHIDGERVRIVDYDGEGLPGLFVEEADGWFYRRNQGHVRQEFTLPERLAKVPNARLSDGWQLSDLNGDGQLDLVRFSGATRGIFERRNHDWQHHHHFDSLPTVDFTDPNLRFVDLDGDGLPDLLINDRVQIRWHQSAGLRGFGSERRQLKREDTLLHPLPLFTIGASGQEALFLADLTGDGLLDIVHVRWNTLTYFPNLGHGRFGQRQLIADTPVLDESHAFDPRRVFFADIDGTGTGDLLYFKADGLHVYRNLSGNRFAPPIVFRSLPPPHRDAHLEVSDLWGTGTATAVWSSSLPSQRARAVQALDLVKDARKPYLLTSITNGFGKTTTIEFDSSTSDYLRDREAGRPWVTRLPFPVQVVRKVTTVDAIAETTLTSIHRYRHGFYDGIEREFRGFGMAEVEDTETIADVTDQLPTLTKTWFHTGAFFDKDRISLGFAEDYFQHPDVINLPDTVLSAGLSPEEEREACRALRGKPLRVEVYALDGNRNPYTITETNYTVRRERAHGPTDRFGVLAVFPRETLTHHLERTLDDPRVLHELVLEISDFGDVTEKAAIAYARKDVAGRRADQATPLVTLTRATFIDLPFVDSPEQYRVGMTRDVRTFDWRDLAPTEVLSWDEVAQAATTATEHDYAQPAARGPTGAWLIEHSKHTYWNDAATAELLFGQAGYRALLARALTLALTRELVNEVWNGRDTISDTVLETDCGYLKDASNFFWASPGLVHFDPVHFFLPVSLEDPFGNESTVHYDSYDLLPDWTEDAAGNRTQLTNDYRTLQPSAITDPNDTIASVVTDALGVVVQTSITNGTAGGVLTEVDYTFGSASTPTVVHAVTHQAFGGSTTEEAWVYSDGSGREIQRKVKAEPDPITSALRFVGSGRTLLNNKGVPVKQYEPYFSATSDFDTEADLVTQGVTPILYYDPVGRLTRTEQPNGTTAKVVIGAWTTEKWDEIDTLEESTPWYDDRIDGTYPREPVLEQDATEKAFGLRGTPTREHFDPLGRTIATVRDAGTVGAPDLHETTLALDIEGNLLSVTDARNVECAIHVFDIAGRRLFVDSVDAGKTWTLPDALGQPILLHRAEASQSEAFRLRHEYDPLRRPTNVWVLPDGASADILRERIVYRDRPFGDSAVPHFSAARVYAELDGAGLLLYEYDFRGKPSRTVRHVLTNPLVQGDWTTDAVWDGTSSIPISLDPEELVTELEYDALGRVTMQRALVGTRASGEIRHAYNEAGLLESVEADLPNRASATVFVSNVDYDAKGRRTEITFGHGAKTEYEYDPKTFRLLRLTTSKSGNVYQDLVYAYDPVGNITAIRDDAQDTHYFANTVVKPLRAYAYDALYRLVEATGREHLDKAAPDQRDIPDPLALPLADPTDLAKIIEYTETYAYDRAGNITALSHDGATTWTREYTYPSTSNRLTSTEVDTFTSTYMHDTRGNLTSMPHLGGMGWNHRDQLIVATRTRRGNTIAPAAATPENAPVFFTYDLRGQRVRKAAESAGGAIKERIYLGGLFELYRERPAATGTIALERETLHVMDDQRRLALVETQTVAGSTQLVRFQHDDHLGSAVLELNESPAPISYEEFQSYGATALSLGTAPKRYRFTSMERDEETGLQCHGVRYYTPCIARWISSDAHFSVENANLFEYAHSNPLAFIDRDGYRPNKTNIFVNGFSAALSWGASQLGISKKTLFGRLVALEREHQRNAAAERESARILTQVRESIERSAAHDKELLTKQERAAEFERQVWNQSAESAQLSREAVPQSWRPGTESLHRMQESTETGDVAIVKDALRDVAGTYVNGKVGAAAFYVGGRVLNRLALPAGRPGHLIPGKLDAHEKAFASEILEQWGGKLDGASKRFFPGIDGRLDGTAISLKETRGGLSAVLRYASQAEAKAKSAGYTGVEVFIKALNVTTKDLGDFARKGPLAKIPSQGTVSAINVLTRDGWMRIVGGQR